MATNFAQYGIPVSEQQVETPTTLPTGTNFSKYGTVMQDQGQSPSSDTKPLGGFNVSGSVGGLLTGAAKGVGSTLFGVSQIGEKIAKTLLPKSLERPDLERPKFLEPTTTAEKIGFGVEQIGEWFIPASKILKVAKTADTALQASKLGKTLSAGGKISKTALTTARVGAKAGIGALEGAAIGGIQSGGDLETMKSAAKFGAAIPIVGKGLSVLGTGVTNVGRALRSTATGVGDDVFARIRTNPQIYDDAMKHVEENAQQPFQGLATAIGNKLKVVKTNAQNTYQRAIETAKTKFPHATFNLENKLPELNKTLNKFNLAIKQTRDASGRLSTAIVAPTTRTSPYTQQEVGAINELVSKMRIKDMSVDELVDFQKSVSTFLGDAIHKDNKKMIVLGHSLVDDSIKFVDEVFPNLKEANTMYSNYYRALERGGNKIVDNLGNTKQTAEQFLSNTQNLNKGEQREALKFLERVTGIPIADNVLIIKDAQKLNNMFPATGSRTLDILRSFVAKGAAGVSAASGGFGNLPGAIGSGAVVGLSSPKLQGRIAIEAAKVTQKLPKLPKGVKNFIDLVTTRK